MRKTNVHLPDKHKYNCEYCHEEFIPKRRFVQKYCSDSCRSKAFHIKNKSNIKPTKKDKKKRKKKKTKIEKMSLAGVGNSAVGTLAIDALTKIFTHENNLPATKADIQSLSRKIKRYHRVTNIASKPDGKLPYFDTETCCVVYF